MKMLKVSKDKAQAAPRGMTIQEYVKYLAEKDSL